MSGSLDCATQPALTKKQTGPVVRSTAQALACLASNQLLASHWSWASSYSFSSKIMMVQIGLWLSLVLGLCLVVLGILYIQNVNSFIIYVFDWENPLYDFSC